MSDDTTPPPPDNKVDLSDLKLMPSWVASFGKEDNRARAAESFSEERDGRGGRGGDRRDGGGRGFGGGGAGGFGRGAGAGGGAGGGGGERRAGGASFAGQRREGGGGAAGAPGGPRRDGPGGGAGFGGPRREGGGGGFRGGDRRDDRGPRFDDRPPLPPGLKLFVEPEDKAADALAQHVRGQGRAFSLFEAARLVLAGPERYRVRIVCEAERTTGLFAVAADGALFETKEEAQRHLLGDSAVLASYYASEEVELEEPKGIFNSVGVCGMSGALLGPASHHSFMTALKRIHAERYSNMAFDDYRRRVRTETDPELIAKWKEQQRKGTKWIYLKGEGDAPAPAPAPAVEAAPVVEGDAPAEGEAPAEAAAETEAEAPAAAEDTRLSFTSRSEMEAHFRRTHGEGAVTEVREFVVRGTIRREQMSPGLGRLVHRTVEDARKHLFELSQKMSQGLEKRGLKLFKRRGGKMFVSRVKPRALDAGVIFSARISAIVELIKKQPGILVSKVAETLAPYPDEPATSETPAETPAAKEPAAEAPEVVVAAAETEATATDETSAAEAAESAPEAGNQATPDTRQPRGKREGKGRPEKKAPAPARPLTDDQVLVIRDLRWLSDEGYVIEYGDGAVFIGVQSDAPREKTEKPKGDRPKKSQETAEGDATTSEETTAEDEETAAEETSEGESIAETEEPSDPPADEETTPTE